MRTRPSLKSAAVLVAASLITACGGSESSPTSPSGSTVSGAPSAAPAPTASAPRLSSDLVGDWLISLRITEATGAGCVAEAFRAQIGEPAAYALSVRDTGQVTITSRSDGLSCSFSAAADGDNGFTTYGIPGFYQCVGEPRTYRCADGTEHRYASFGQDIDGKASGSRISGTWMVFWYEMGNDAAFVEAKAQFSGAK